MKNTSQRSLLFRQNVNRTEAEWVHFLDGYRKSLIEFDMKKFGDDWHTAEDIVEDLWGGFVGWDPLDSGDFYCKTVRFSKITQKEAECDA